MPKFPKKPETFLPPDTYTYGMHCMNEKSFSGLMIEKYRPAKAPNSGNFYAMVLMIAQSQVAIALLLHQQPRKSRLVICNLPIGNYTDDLNST